MASPLHAYRSLITTLLLLCTEISRAAIAIDIEGLDAELEAAARNGLEMQQYAARSVSAMQVNRLFARGEDDIRKALQAYGYYDAKVTGDLQRGKKEGDYRVVFRVTPGEPVIVRDVRIHIEGDAAELPAIKAALADFRPRVGDRLQHGVYEGSKSSLTTLLQTNGYFDAALERHRVEVVLATKSATVDLAWVSGERYRFGDVHFSEVQFPEEFLKRYVPWKADAYYTTEQLLSFQQRLVDADYFSIVSAQPDLQNKRDGYVPIQVLLLPAKRTVYRVGAYVSTDLGLGVRLGAEQRWINRHGHKAGLDLQYSQRLQQYSAFYRVPRPGERNRNYNFGVGYRDERTETSRSRLARAVASEVLDQWHGFTRTLGLQYVNGDFEIANEIRPSNLLWAEGSLVRKRADDPVFPRRGFSVLYGVRLAAESVVSDTSLAQIRAEAKWIRPTSSRSRGIMRAAVGAMTVKNFDALPPELRFFAGGDRSIRGFGYQEIGEVNASGGVIGGKYLAIASVEYEYYFLPRWGVATFIDAGDAFSTSFQANVGSGLGVRWRSPVGIVRVDVATPIVTELQKSVRLHIVIGPDL